MKKILILFLSIVTLAAISGCNNTPTEFPQEAEEIGVYEEETESESSTPGNEEVERLLAAAEDADLGTVAPEDIIGWFEPYVSSDYVQNESDGGSLITQTAELSSGGYISVASYSDVYFSTSFSYPDLSDTGVLYDKSVEFLNIFFERGLTTNEATSLKSAIEASVKSTDVVYVEAFMEKAPIYITVSESTYTMICSSFVN